VIWTVVEDGKNVGSQEHNLASHRNTLHNELTRGFDILVCCTINEKRVPTFWKRTAKSEWDYVCIKCTFLSIYGLSEVSSTLHFKIKTSCSNPKALSKLIYEIRSTKKAS
jgi:hypothetical protein